jgi:uncharacterized tellurite resistance protein B-like protein
VLDRLKALFADRDDLQAAPGGTVDPLHLAAACLLVEAAQMDDDFDAEERAKIGDLLRRRFDLSAADSDRLLQTAEAKVAQSVEIFGFTREIKDAFSAKERIEMMEMLWDVAYADGSLHDHEANLMRRLAGLLHVSDRDSGLARKRILAQRGLEG